VDRGAERDVGQRQGVANSGLNSTPATTTSPTFSHWAGACSASRRRRSGAGRCEPIDSVVFDRRQLGRHPELVPFEIDDAIVLLLAATAMANGEPA